MCERSETNPNPNAGTVGQTNFDDPVASGHRAPRLEVGPIFGTVKKTDSPMEAASTKTNNWFRQNGGI
jgi:hypothetical protein